MRPFQPPFTSQNQVRGGSDPSLNRLLSSSSALPNQFGFTNPQNLMPTIGEFNNQNALLGTLLAQQQLIQGLQNNLMAALSQQGLIPQFNGQQNNLIGGLQNPNLMPLRQGGLLGRPPSNQNLNQAMGCPPNGFLCSQKPNFAPNSHIPVISSGNTNPVFLGNVTPQVPHSISNSPCLETQLVNQNLKRPILTSPVQNIQSNGQWLQIANVQTSGKKFSSNSSENVVSSNFKTKFNGFGRRDPSQTRFQKSQCYSSRNAWKKEGSSPNDGRGQRQRTERNTKLPKKYNNSSIMLKRPLAVIYNESEVQQWREARKKNFPTRANIEKKLSAKEDMHFDAKALRKQLMEVLAKQAELGVEVAEIPSIYLTESEKQVSRNTNVDSASNINARTPHNHFNNKRGRFRHNNWNSKKRKFNGEASPAHEPVVKKREPTLLRKLLNADIRRDKSQLLQAFRFMVLNSFFTISPDKPLVFPIITAKDAYGPEVEVVVEKKLSQGDVALLQGSSTPSSEVVSAKELPQNDVESVSTSTGKSGNVEDIGSDSDGIHRASAVVCDAIDEKSEEGEITN